MKFGLINRIQQEKSCKSFKNHAENEAGKLVPDFFLFLEMLYISQK